MKVYIVYDAWDESPVAVFTDEVKANEFADRGDTYRVCDFILDAEMEGRGGDNGI